MTDPFKGYIEGLGRESEWQQEGSSPPIPCRTFLFAGRGFLREKIPAFRYTTVRSTFSSNALERAAFNYRVPLDFSAALSTTTCRRRPIQWESQIPHRVFRRPRITKRLTVRSFRSDVLLFFFFFLADIFPDCPPHVFPRWVFFGFIRRFSSSGSPFPSRVIESVTTGTRPGDTRRNYVATRHFRAPSWWAVRGSLRNVNRAA